MSAIAIDTPVRDVEPWEVHSELVLVSPDVCRRALELLPERDPDAFLTRPQPVPAGGTSDEGRPVLRLPAAVLGYALLRFAQNARFALLVVGVIVALALIVEVVH